MKRIKKKFIINLISWSISLALGICVAIISSKLTDNKLFSTILLVSGIVDAACSFIVLAIFVPYSYYLDKSINRLTKKLLINEEANKDGNK